MNILFANYGDCTTNSLNHIGAFANQLIRLGHSCVVAVSEKPHTREILPNPLFAVKQFEEMGDPAPVFPNRFGADVVHAWTPRENVREFTMRYLAQCPEARLFIHLEDNEDHLTATYLQKTMAQLRELPDDAVARILPRNLSHPLRARHFLQVAHGVTHITERLREAIPADKPHHLLLPGMEEVEKPDPAAVANLRRDLALTAEEKLIVYTGSTTFANLADMKGLTLAVRLLNESGLPTRLVRTGLHPQEYAQQLHEVGGKFVTDLGFVPKSRLPALLAAADALVQPGSMDDFNAYRLPSKLPEFLWAGRPTILPVVNLGAHLQDRQEGLLLAEATPQDIAERCREVFTDADLAATLAQGAHAFARTHFDLINNTTGLLEFYQAARDEPGVFGKNPPAGNEAAVLVDRIDLELGQRVRGLAQQIEQLQEQLSQVRRDRARHAAGERYNASRIEAEKHVTENVRQQLAQLVDELVPQNNRLTTEVGDLRNLVEHNERQYRQRLDALQDKLRRITQSSSWAFTAPLRALRRTLLDPWRRREEESAAGIEPANPDPVPAIPIDPGLLHSLDEPADWAAIPARGLMRGWVVASDGQEIVQVRIRADDQEFEVCHGIARPDVISLHPDLEFAGRAGFVCEYDLAADWAGETVFDALTADGDWRRFAARHTQVMTGSAHGLRHHYREWVQQFDTLALADTINHRARLEAMPASSRPLISLLMPVHDTARPWLIRAIKSVRDQLYANWELCIANDASVEPHVARILDDFAQRDARIKIVHRPVNGHICAASNSALELATGKYCGLLDHDDELAPHALAEVVYALSAQPDLEFIYSDEDKIDEAGHRTDPYFKPDWNPELLLGQNYTCHLSVFGTDRLRDIGGFREGLEGSQDWDLTLRATADLDESRIHHIAKVLYHWRAIPGSTALVIDQKDDYPVLAAQKALADHLQNQGMTAELQPVPGRYWRVRHPLPSPVPRVSLIIPTHNGYELLRTCLDSIRSRTDYPDFEILVVNHASDDPTLLTYFRELETEGISVLDFTGEFNFSAMNNLAARHASGQVLGFLNNDLEVINADWLTEMVSQAWRPEIGAVGAMLYFPDDTVQHAGVILGIGGLNGSPSVAGHAFKHAQRGSDGQRNRLRLTQNYSAVTAACLVIRRSIFEEVDGFDEAQLPVAFNDIDLCLKIRQAGYRNLWTPFAEFYHHESASRGLEDSPGKLDRFTGEIAVMRQRWAAQLDHDPAYNPNLTAEFEDFSFAVPPRG